MKRHDVGVLERGIGHSVVYVGYKRGSGQPSKVVSKVDWFGFFQRSISHRNEQDSYISHAFGTWLVGVTLRVVHGAQYTIHGSQRFPGPGPWSSLPNVGQDARATGREHARGDTARSRRAFQAASSGAPARTRPADRRLPTRPARLCLVLPGAASAWPRGAQSPPCQSGTVGSNRPLTGGRDWASSLTQRSPSSPICSARLGHDRGLRLAERQMRGRWLWAPARHRKRHNRKRHERLPVVHSFASRGEVPRAHCVF